MLLAAKTCKGECVFYVYIHKHLFLAEPVDESFACKNCGKMYSNPASLIGHLKYKCNTGKKI